MRKDVAAILIGIGVEITFYVLGEHFEVMPMGGIIAGYIAGGLFILLGLVFLICPKKVSKTDGVLDIGGKVKSLERINANHVILCQGTKEGNIIALVEAVFNPSNPPISPSRIALEVWGKQLVTNSKLSSELNKGDSWNGFFEIPQELEKHNTKARLVVDALGNRYFSSEFPIPFEKVKD